jgi:glucose/mannose-6-phosphate isomerase
MFDLAAALPEQVEAAAALAGAAGPLPPREEIENIVVLGMGGSGIAGDVLVAVAGMFMAVPIVVVKSHSTPSFVGPATLCFAISYSGDTEETVEAAQEAVAAGARLVAMSHGGDLADLAAGEGAPHIELPAIVKPRAGIGMTSIPPLMVLERIGLFPGAAGWVAEAVDQLKRRRDLLVRPGGEGEQIARRLAGTIPLIYGGNSLGHVAAVRWKTQINENAKAPAFASTLPEAGHNELSGWGQHGDMTRQVLSYVELRGEHEHPQVTRRFELIRDQMAEVTSTVVEVMATGEGQLAQLFDLIIRGDFVSLHLAALAGIDPGPIPALDDLKRALQP